MEKESLRKRIEAIENEIAEVKKRLPAHSVKPPIMMELLALEDERDGLMKRMAGDKG